MDTQQKQSLAESTKQQTLSKDKAKELAAQATANVITHIPAFGLNFVIKKIKKNIIKSFEENPENEDLLVRTIKRDFSLKMADIFLETRKSLSKNCRKKLFQNVFVNAIQKGRVQRLNFYAQNGFTPPGTIVINPTMRCNLSCEGCYAFEYNKNKNGDLSYETLERIINEGKSMGVYFFVVTGGEPLIRKDDLFKLAKKHNDCMFMMYTNATLITKEVAAMMEETGNWVPCLSVEGYEADIDKRRGKGVGEKVLRAMQNLKEAGVGFAISVTVMKHNQDLVSTKEFLKFWHDKGAFAAWYFQYMPVGKKPNFDLVPTPEQRREQRKRIHDMRKDSDVKILVMDFWSDGPLVNGCLAAGIGYLNITGDGKIQPCVFTHFDVGNINDMTILDALNTPFFKKYRELQKTVKDRYRPCGIIDHPEHLREAFKAGGVQPSYEGADDIITDPEAIKRVDQYSKDLEATVGQDWKEGKE